MARLTGKSVIVTGATSGIGRTIAERLHAEGAHVLITGRDERRGKALADSLGEGSVFHAADLTDPRSAQEVVTTALSKFGALDVLVNNAARDHTGDLLTTPINEIRDTFEVNAFAAIRMLQIAAQAMRERGGSIVNVTSRLATIGVPTMAIYSASKGAIRALTRAAAIELAPLGIRVNDVAPGMTHTPLYDAWLARQSDPAATARDVVSQIPLGRLASPEDVAWAVLYLASDESRYVTGSTIPVDGGYTAK
jgi:NAD(P)-dependent dehydrogenase (short-subunit alcohol dehydrogenase family)